MYYAGHGFMHKGTTAILLNSSDPSKMKWDIENKMRSLGILKGAYVVCLFDCCREIFDFDKEVEKVKISNGMGLERA